MDGEYKELLSRVEETLVSITWTHKIHEKQADICDLRAKRLSVASILITALTASGSLGLFALDDFVLKFLTALLAFASLCLNMLAMAFDFSGTSLNQRHAAKQFLALREDGKDLLSLLRGGCISLELARADYRTLREKYSLACSLAPQTNDAAVKKAEIALSNGESTVTERERERLTR